MSIFVLGTILTASTFDFVSNACFLFVVLSFCRRFSLRFHRLDSELTVRLIVIFARVHFAYSDDDYTSGCGEGVQVFYDAQSLN